MYAQYGDIRAKQVDVFGLDLQRVDVEIKPLVPASVVTTKTAWRKVISSVLHHHSWLWGRERE